MVIRLSRLIFFIIMLVFAYQTISTALDYNTKSAKIKAEQEEIDKMRQEEKTLKETLKKVKSREFIEEEARNKLNMCRPGETIVIGK